LVEVNQSRYGDLHAQGLIGALADGGAGRVGKLLAQGQLPRALGDDLGIQAVKPLALLERLPHARHGMNLQ
jgi:hypothetical protein